MDPLDQVGDPTKGQYGILKIQTSPLGIESTSASTDINGNIFLNVKILFNLISFFFMYLKKRFFSFFSILML